MNPQRNLNDNDIENAGHPGYAAQSSANSPLQPLSNGKYAQSAANQKGVRSFHALKAFLIGGLLLAAAIGVVAVVILLAQSSTKRLETSEKKDEVVKTEALTAQQTIENTAV